MNCRDRLSRWSVRGVQVFVLFSKSAQQSRQVLPCLRACGTAREHCSSDTFPTVCTPQCLSITRPASLRVADTAARIVILCWTVFCFRSEYPKGWDIFTPPLPFGWLTTYLRAGSSERRRNILAPKLCAIVVESWEIFFWYSWFSCQCELIWGLFFFLFFFVL